MDRLQRAAAGEMLDLMGHAKLDSTRVYTRSSATDRAQAIDTTLVVDE